MLVEDAVEKVIGRFGKYQTLLLVLYTIGGLPNHFQLTNVVFLLPSVDYVCRDEGAYNITNYCPCQNPEYDQSTIISSVTTEWNLICSKTSLASFAQSTLAIGVLAGSIIYGHISDRYGRKSAVLLGLLSSPIFVIISAVAPNIWVFMICRFLSGTSVGGTMLCGYVLLIELSGKTFRPYMVGLYETSHVSAYFLIPIFAYFFREWRYLQLVTSVPWLLVVVYYWIIPESPRWLITAGKKQEAIGVLTYIAKKNNLPIENIEAVVDEAIKQSNTENQHKHGTYLDLFKTPKIRTYTIINALVWMFCSHTYFGVSQYIGRLQGNLYLNVMLTATCLVPSLGLMILVALYLPRKLSVISSFIISGVSLLLLIFIPAHIQAANLALAIIGLIFIYICFSLIYLYSSEIFPTIIRNSAMGFASMFARIGSMIAPFVVNIGVDWISILIFSSLAFCGGFLCYFFPETRGIVLLNTIEQTEKSKIEIIERNETEKSVKDSDIISSIRN